ncbi:MAG: N-acetylmuramoyl-L-alanine amidase, partial [Carnobacterium sp.]
DWYHVKASDGTEGYVANWLVDLSATAEAAPTAQISSLSEATIVIDPGHGGSDPGAEGSNYYESEITLSTAEILADRLRQSGANVILTRTTDTDVGLRDRAYISNQAKADVFISIHYDSTPNPNEGSGTTTYYYSDSNKALAKAVNNGLSKGPLPNNGYRFGDHQVTRENAQPALLLEMGYVNNDTDSALITTKSYQQTMSNHIVDALTNYFNK